LSGASSLPPKPAFVPPPPPPGGARKPGTGGGGGLFVPKASQRASLATRTEHHRPSNVDLKAVNASNMSTADRLRAELLSGNSAAPIARPKITGADLSAAASNASAAARLKADLNGGSAFSQRAQISHADISPSSSSAPLSSSSSYAQAAVETSSSISPVQSGGGGIPGLDFEPSAASSVPVSSDATVSTPAAELMSESMDGVEATSTSLAAAAAAEATETVAETETSANGGGEAPEVEGGQEEGSSPRGVKRTADEAEIPKTRSEAANGDAVEQVYQVEEDAEGDLPVEKDEDMDEEDEGVGDVGPTNPPPLKMLGDNMVEQEDTVK
jgi:hypothetical protein